MLLKIGHLFVLFSLTLCGVLRHLRQALVSAVVAPEDRENQQYPRGAAKPNLLHRGTSNVLGFWMPELESLVFGGSRGPAR
jgi:hypothetical protein